MSAAAKTSGQTIWEAIIDLHGQEQIVTREVLAEVTGLRMTVIDDHVGRMVDDERLRRVKAGVFVPIIPMPPARAVSLTDLPDGTTILEVGDFILKMVPKERRSLAMRLVGDAVQYSNIQAGNEAGVLAVELAGKIRKLEKELAAFKNKVDREPQMDLLGA